MSKIKTLVLLFPLLTLMLTRASFGNGHSSGNSSSYQCLNFYFKNLKKPLFKPPEAVPVGGIWDNPKNYSPSPTNHFFNHSDTRNLDQRFSRECFIFSFLGALESTHVNRHFNARKIDFSGAYLIAKKFEHVIGEIVSNNQNGNGMYFKLDGGETYHAMKLVELYGLVPENIWTPRVPMEHWNFQKIYDKIIEDVNVVINNRNQNPNFYSPNDYPAIVQRIFRNALKDDIWGDYIGEWPKPFWYDGIHYTPETFGQMYGFDRHGKMEIRYSNLNGPYQNYIQTLNLPFFINPMFQSPAFNQQHFAEHTQALFENVKKALTANRAVLIDVDGYDAVVGHQFVITDLEILPNGVVKAVRLKNSYTNWGLGGYAWYRPEAIAKVLRRIWIIDINSDIPPIAINPQKN